MLTRPAPPKEIIDRWLRYDAVLGTFTWIIEPRPCRPLVGTVAGTRRPSGYVFIALQGHGTHAAGRLAWTTARGPIPDGLEIDHRDGDPSNNRLSNLRLATSSQQKMNRSVQSNNGCGLKGAYFHSVHKGKKWRSQIKVGGRLIFLGYFDSAERAHAAYQAAAVKHFGEFARAA